jgi:hypothetical protein
VIVRCDITRYVHVKFYDIIEVGFIVIKEYSHERSRDSSVGIATGYGLDDQGEWEFE